MLRLTPTRVIQAMPAPVHRPSYLLYNALVVPPGVVGLHLARFFSPKVQRGLEGRLATWERLESSRTELRGAVWFHAASVGEYEQARPVLRALAEECERRGGDFPTLQTVFSPSGWDFAQTRNDADFLEYLPLDTPAAESAMTLSHSSAGMVVSSILSPSTRSLASPPQYQTWR